MPKLLCLLCSFLYQPFFHFQNCEFTQVLISDKKNMKSRFFFEIQLHLSQQFSESMYGDQTLAMFLHCFRLYLFRADNNLTKIFSYINYSITESKWEDNLGCHDTAQRSFLLTTMIFTDYYDSSPKQNNIISFDLQRKRSGFSSTYFNYSCGN